ncbi:MAG: response regulator [Clostridiales bacterium]|nr:response regulator [Clostridiales bacterium]
MSTISRWGAAAAVAHTLNNGQDLIEFSDECLPLRMENKPLNCQNRRTAFLLPKYYQTDCRCAMITFIIVDDEPLARENFAALCDWRQKGYDLVGFAANGVQAQRLIREKRPDIVFTDVKMPVMDGLELCDWLHREYPYIRSVILSAYQDFEYVRDALKHGVKEYIIKNHLTADAVLKLMDRLSDEINKEKSEESRKKEDQIQRTILGMESGHIAANGDGAQQCLCMLIQFRTSYIIEYFDVPQAFDIKLSRSLLRDMLPEGSGLCVSQLLWTSETSRAIIFKGMPDTRMSFSWLKRDITVFADNLNTYFSENAQIEVLELMDFCKASMEKIKEKIEHLKKVAAHTPFIYKTYIGSAKEIEARFTGSSYRKSDVNECMRSLEAQVKVGNVDGVKELLNAVKRKFIVNEPDLKLFRYLCGKVFDYLEFQMKDCSIYDLKQHITSHKEYFMRIVMAEQIWLWIEQKLIELTEIFANSGIKTENVKIQQVLQYIRKNYSKPLTAKDVGEAVGLSTVYFSNLFKRETGVNFGEYLRNYRINVAKYLLAEQDYKIYEISEMIGYASPQYFSQVFQKKVGMTPLMYKNYHSASAQRNEVNHNVDLK